MEHPTDGASPAMTTLEAEPGLPPGALAVLELSAAADADADAGSGQGRGPGSLARRLGLLTSVLVLGLVATLGFVAGVNVQKGQKTTAVVPTGAGGGAAAFAALAGGGGFPGAGGAGGAGRTGGAAGAPGAAGAAATGTVKLVDGANIYLTDATGNVIKVTTSDASRFTRSGPGTVGDVRPGDTVVVQGQRGDDGTVAAIAVTSTSAAR